MASWTPLNKPAFNGDTMLLLTDGTVMCHEFESNKWHRLSPDDSGSYVHGSWSELAPLLDDAGIPASKGGPTNAPLYFASAVFSDGRVFVAGGEYNSGNANADILTAQIYDPVSDRWRAIKTPAGWAGIGDAPSCVLADGRLLLGQYNGNSTAIYNPRTDLWQAAGAKGDSNSEETFTLLPNGNVVSVQCSNIPNAEQYIPSSDTWIGADSTPSTLPQACQGLVAEIGPAILLPNGTVFAVGATGQSAIYSPNPVPTKAGTWSKGPALVDSSNATSFPMDAPAVLLPSGQVLLVGSPAPPCNYPGPTTFHLYDPPTNSVKVVPGPSNNGGPAYTGRMLLLPTGQVLFSNNSTEIQIYTADGSPLAAWKPVITACPDTLIAGQTHLIAGTQFNGLSQACSYGDDAQMATNYPIARISNNAGRVIYLRSSNHSTMAVATGTVIVSTQITVPANVPKGPWNFQIVANGIPSDPFPVMVDTRASDIQELRLEPGAGWAQADLSVIVVDNPPAVRAAGHPSAYVTPDGIPRVIYTSVDGHVQELRLEPHVGWVQADLSTIVVNKPPAGPATGDPIAYITRDGIARAVYLSGDGHVRELRLQPGVGWVQADLSAIVVNNAPAVPAAGAPFPYVTPDGIPRIVYTSVDGHVHELRLQPNMGWVQADLSAIVVNNAPAVPAASRPFAYVTPDAIPRVVYTDAIGHVHELRLQPGVGWVQADLSAIVVNNAPAVPAAGAPFPYVTPDGIPRIVYTSVDGHVHELRLQPNMGWVQADLSAIVVNNAPAVPAASRPFAYVTPDAIPRVVYTDAIGHVHELRLQPGVGWVQADLSAIVVNNAPAVPAKQGTPFAYVTPDKVSRIIYSDTR